MNTIFQFIIFLLTTITYFMIGKQTMSFNETGEDNGNTSVYITNIYYSAFYLIVVIISQLLINMVAIANECKTNALDNVGISFMFSFFPWFIMFGSVILVMIMFPNLKSIFGNIIGYIAISSQVNDIFQDLLMTPPYETNDQLATLITKIYTDKSLLINEFNMNNFESMFTTLEKLLKEPNDTAKTLKHKQELFQLIQKKDNIGEFCWYLYSGIVVISFVGYKIASNGCKQTLESIQNTYKEYKKNEDKKQEEQTLLQNQLFTY